MISTTASKKKKIWKLLVSVVFWTGAWFLLSVLINKELIFPSPIEVLKHLGLLMGEESFWLKTGISLLRVLSGFITGVMFGVLLAVLSVVSDICDAIIAPFIRLVRSTPVASFVMLVMLWISYDLVPVLIAALLVTPIIYANVREGILETSRALLEVTEIYHFPRMKTLKILYAPSVRPYFVSGAMTSLGLAWKAGIAAEVLSLPSGAIGREIYYSKLYLETADLFAWTVVVIAFSYMFEKLLERVVQNRRRAELRRNPEEERQNAEEKQQAPAELRQNPEEEKQNAEEKQQAPAELRQNTEEEKQNAEEKQQAPAELRQNTEDSSIRSRSGITAIDNNQKNVNNTYGRGQINIRDTSVSFENKRVLDGLNISFNEGITCLMGNSGSGKTTLLRVLSGLERAESGSVENVPERISLMFQEDRLFPWLSAIDNVAVVCDDTERAEKLLTELELKEDINKLPSELSGGMRRRVALARALACDCELLILDEPFKGLDEALKVRVCRLVKGAEAKTIIVATHDRRDPALLEAETVQLQ